MMDYYGIIFISILITGVIFLHFDSKRRMKSFNKDIKELLK